MGLYWSFTMPLLSTLAALVIIVHSAEEDLEEFRRDLRPRVSDTGTTNYELPWRAVRVEPMMTQSTQTDTWDGSPEDQPKRRRPSRKRRRRPQPSSEVFAQQEGYSEQREYQYNGENYRPFTQIPQRRRKKIDPKQKEWGNEPVESARPSRRKGVRRKANADEPWRELSEFGDPPLEEYVETNETPLKPEPANYEPDFENNDGNVPQLTLNHFFKYDEKNGNQEVTKDGRSYEESDDEPSQMNKENEYDENLMLQGKEDKSLSEFSMEINDPAKTSKNRSDQAKPFKGNLNDLKEQRPLDPSSLKEILKKSKGKSLSELLQQHNLTLADLLNGEKKVLSVLKSSDTLQNNKQVTDAPESLVHAPVKEEPKASLFSEAKLADQNVEEPAIVHNKPIEITTPESPILTTGSHVIKKVINSHGTTPRANLSSVNKGHSNVSSNNHHKDKVKLNETSKIFLRRRLPVGIRMKLRMRPLNSNFYKGQLSRDLIALSTQKFQHNRNSTKLRDWKDIIPAVINKTQTKFEDKLNIFNNAEDNYNSSITPAPMEPTVDDVTTDTGVYTDSENEMQTEDTNTNSVTTTTVPTIEVTTTVKVTTTLKPIVYVAPRLNATSLRNQAFTNRLRRKKLRLNALTNATSESLDHKLKDIFDMANLVSASEFIARIHQNPTTATDEAETATALEDFITTETTTKRVTQMSTKRYTTREKLKTSTTPHPTLKTSTTENAKIEIDEILDDASVRDRLSRILMERNMTLSELVEHRERGSSHVHLADIFHNASKEPNPPEPFLSKSLIEPISKETYPLRALLEANLHDQTIKPTTVEPYLFPLHYINVPIAMDFGNNVNENSENSGIIALFNNFTAAVEKTTKPSNVEVNKSNEETTTTEVANTTSRESHVFNTDQDLISLNEIFSLMQKTRNHRQEPQAVSSEVTSSNKSEVDRTVEDVDGDGLIALEDLQHIKNMKIDKGFYTEKVESKLLESLEGTATMNTPETIHNNTRSVTVVTASIVGLIAVLFLVTYAAFKWKHQQQVFRRKHCASEDRIPTPVFENRKSNKNSSMRSLSPMLSSNIYSVNTLEKPNNNECPEYMWDSLRKPFQ